MKRYILIIILTAMLSLIGGWVFYGTVVPHDAFAQNNVLNDHHIITYPKRLIVPKGSTYVVVTLCNENGDIIGVCIEFYRFNEKISEIVCLDDEYYTFKEQVESILMLFKE